MLRILISFGGNLLNKYGKKLLNAAATTKLDALKTASKKLTHKAFEATGEYTGNKIANKITKAKAVLEARSRNVEEIIMLSVKPKKY